MYRVQCDYAGDEENNGSLPLQEGERIVLLQTLDDEWARVQSARPEGDAGLVPLRYLEVCYALYHSNLFA